MENVLLCATDAGGARNAAPLLEEIKNRGYQPVLITSKKMMNLFNLDSVNVINSESIDLSTDSVIQLIETIKPLAIISGTTRYNSIDRLSTSIGKKRGIRTVVVLDEWFNYHLRFRNNHNELVYLPDAIAAMDEMAIQGAVKEEIPENILYKTGSPSLADLTTRAETFIEKPPDIPEFLKDEKSVPIFTYLSELHSVNFGTKKGEKGPLGPFLGYTENTVKEDIMSVLMEINKPCTAIEKLHPSSELNDEKVTFDKIISWVRVKKTNLWPLFWYSDAVIGMKSMALLEARILNVPAVSYQPGLLVENTCTAVKLGLVKRLSTFEELRNWLRYQFDKFEESKKRIINRFPFAREDAAQRVVDLAIK